MNTRSLFFLLGLLLFPIGVFAQPFGSMSEAQQYFDSNGTVLDSIEGIYVIKHYDVFKSSSIYFQDRSSRWEQTVAIVESPIRNEYNIYDIECFKKLDCKIIKNTILSYRYDKYGDYPFEVMFNTVTFNSFSVYYEKESGGAYLSFSQIFIKIYPTEESIAQNNRDARIDESYSSWSGSGFALGDSYVATNYHVIEGASSILIYGVNGHSDIGLSAKAIASDKQNDLALLKIDDTSFKGFGAIPYSIRSSMAEVGEDVFVLGYPLTQYMGNEIKLTSGLISSRSGYQGDITTYQISAPVQPGNSGGPVFDKKGNIIGIVNAGIPGADNVGYAIKMSYLLNLIETALSSNILPTTNMISNIPLTQQVAKTKNYVYLIECTSRGSQTLKTSPEQSAHDSDNQGEETQREISIRIGETVQMRLNQKDVWWESDYACVKVTREGLVTGLSVGSACVWAHMGGSVKLYKVTVSE